MPVAGIQVIGVNCETIFLLNEGWMLSPPPGFSGRAVARNVLLRQNGSSLLLAVQCPAIDLWYDVERLQQSRPGRMSAVAIQSGSLKLCLRRCHAARTARCGVYAASIATRLPGSVAYDFRLLSLRVRPSGPTEPWRLGASSATRQLSEFALATLGGLLAG